jgi:predicted HicB family RNase H-like nuclease
VDIVNHGATPMARKMTEKPTMPAIEMKLRAVRLELSEEEHAALRVEAAKQDVSLMQLARVAVREYLGRRKSGAK